MTGVIDILWRPVRELPDLLAGNASNTTTVMVSVGLMGVAAGLVGCFTLLRKRSLTSDALSHAALPGVAGAFLLAPTLGLEPRALPVLLGGAAIAGSIGVLCVQALARRPRVTEDAAIALVLGVFFGAGVVLLGVAQSRAGGSAGGLHHLIYGQTAAMLPGDAALMAGLAVVAVVATLLLHKELALASFDRSFARATGWPAHAIDVALLALVVLVTVSGLQAVGLLLIVAMVVIPPASARFWSERLGVVAALSAALGGVSAYAGAGLSALAPRQPAGAVIVLTAGGVFAVSFLFAPARGVVPAVVRRARLRLRIAGDHLVEALHDAVEDGGDMGGAIGRIARLRRWGSLRARLLTRWLAWRGLIERADGAWRLTDAGARRGARVARNHRLWTRYLVTYAEVAPSHVDWSVDQVEHILTPALIAELETAMAAEAMGEGVGA